MESVYELSWMATQQVIVTSDNKGEKIKGFGSGFFIEYKDKLFFITADHVVHIEDHEVQMRVGKDDYIWVINNINSNEELSTMLTPIGGLYSFDQINLIDDLSLEIPDMEDISFAILPNSFKNPFLTNELKIEDKILVPCGKEKIIIKSECLDEIKETDYCLVESCVHWNLDGIKLNRSNCIYQDLKLDGIDAQGDIILKYPFKIIHKDWAGISGAPVFNDSGRLIGMIIEVSEHNDTIKVIPMKKILKLMDIALFHESIK